MRRTLLIAERELTSMLTSPAAWVIAGVVLCVDGLLFNAFALGSEPKPSQRVLEELFQIVSGTTMVSAVLISMRLFVEERESGSLLLLFNSKARNLEIVLGKYLGALGFLTLLVLLSSHLLALIATRGTLAGGHVVVGFVGLLLLGAASLSIGLLGSVLARSQLVAGLLGGALLATFLIGWLLSGISDAPLSDVLMYLAMWQSHFLPLERGVLGLSHVVYFASVTLVCLAASSWVLGGQRWD
jgi:ABC-2 type transport system permease protein